jgi:cyclase
MTLRCRPLFPPALLLAFSVVAMGAEAGSPAKVGLRTTRLAGCVSVLEGADGFAGGNIAVCAGEDGILLVDDGLPEVSSALVTAVGAISGRPVRFVINTHWHYDHVGGNAALTGRGSTVIAHDATLRRLSSDQFIEAVGQKFPAAVPAARPLITFVDDITIHLNGDEIHVLHVPPAHTDGDVIVHFKRANVVHMGDLWVSNSYPIVDVSSGGQFDNFIAAADRVLALCDDATRIIPGHGPVAGRNELHAWRDMLAEIRSRVVKLVAAKKTLADVQASRPSADFDGTYGQGFVKGTQLVDWIFRNLPASEAR